MPKSDRDRTLDRKHFLDMNIERIEMCYLNFKSRFHEEPVVFVIDPTDSLGERVLDHISRRDPAYGAKTDQRIAQAAQDGVRPTLVIPVAASALRDPAGLSAKMRGAIRKVIGERICAVAIAEEGKSLGHFPLPESGRSPGEGDASPHAYSMSIILTCSTPRDELVRLMQTMRDARAASFTEHIALGIHGFDDDARELGDIPEARALLNRLVAMGFVSYLDACANHPGSPFVGIVNGVEGAFAMGALEVWAMLGRYTEFNEDRHREFRTWLAQANSAADRILALMAAPVRRNAPCPCGSGKKFKQCCRP